MHTSGEGRTQARGLIVGGALVVPCWCLGGALVVPWGCCALVVWCLGGVMPWWCGAPLTAPAVKHEAVKPAQRLLRADHDVCIPSRPFGYDQV